MAIGTYKGVPINQGTDEQVAAQVAAINNGTGVPSNGALVNPLPDQVQVQTDPRIPLSTLQAPVVAPAKTQPAPVSSAAAGFDGYTTSLTDSFQNNLNSVATQAKTDYGSALDNYLRAEIGAKTKSGLESDFYSQKGGVDDSNRALQSVIDQMTAEKASANAQIKKIQSSNTFGGLSDPANAKIAEIQTQSAARQAELAVSQLAAQGQVTLAKDTADRAINAILDQQKQHIDVLGQIAAANKDIFTTADQRAFDASQAERQRLLTNQEYRLRAQFDENIRESAPDYQLSLQEKRANIANTYSQIADRQAASAANNTLNGKAQTATQAQIQGYADRTLQADAILSQFGDKFASKTLGNILGSSLPSILQTSDRQQYQQAQTNFINAVLRRESGAVVSPTEFSNGSKQYFPQAGDSAATIAQKAANRQTVINNLYQQANVASPSTGSAGDTKNDPLGLGIGSPDPTSTNPLGI